MLGMDYLYWGSLDQWGPIDTPNIVNTVHALGHFPWVNGKILLLKTS